MARRPGKIRIAGNLPSGGGVPRTPPRGGGGGSVVRGTSKKISTSPTGKKWSKVNEKPKKQMTKKERYVLGFRAPPVPWGQRLQDQKTAKIAIRNLSKGQKSALRNAQNKAHTYRMKLTDKGLKAREQLYDLTVRYGIRKK